LSIPKSWLRQAFSWTSIFLDNLFSGQPFFLDNLFPGQPFPFPDFHFSFSKKIPRRKKKKDYTNEFLKCVMDFQKKKKKRRRRKKKVCGGKKRWTTFFWTIFFFFRVFLFFFPKKISGKKKSVYTNDFLNCVNEILFSKKKKKKKKKKGKKKEKKNKQKVCLVHLYGTTDFQGKKEKKKGKDFFFPKPVTKTTFLVPPFWYHFWCHLFGQDRTLADAGSVNTRWPAHLDRHMQGIHKSGFQINGDGPHLLNTDIST
jgi:hypothetical protein